MEYCLIGIWCILACILYELERIRQALEERRF